MYIYILYIYIYIYIYYTYMYIYIYTYSYATRVSQIDDIVQLVNYCNLQAAFCWVTSKSNYTTYNSVQLKPDFLDKCRHIFRVVPRGSVFRRRIIHNLEIPLSIPYQKVALARPMATAPWVGGQWLGRLYAAN
jgi:hypothetical protein